MLLRKVGGGPVQRLAPPQLELKVRNRLIRLCFDSALLCTYYLQLCSTRLRDIKKSWWGAVETIAPPLELKVRNRLIRLCFDSALLCTYYLQLCSTPSRDINKIWWEGLWKQWPLNSN